MSRYLTNSNYTERWTCPDCYHDHDSMVTECAGCGVTLRCTIELEPVPYCWIDDDQDAD